MTIGKKLGLRLLVASFVVLGLVTAARPGVADAPPGRYTITNGGMSLGTVLDTKTGLLWQQAPSPLSFTQAAASTHCASTWAGMIPGPWRLPSLQELLTIVDDSQQSPPAIDTNAFPGTPASAFWTATVQSGGVRYVTFTDGGTFLTAATSSLLVRCVR